MFLPLGGTIDYEAGTLERPPSWVTDAGFEWLYRLVREPRQRWHRYLVHQPPVLYLLAEQRLGLQRDPFGDGSRRPMGRTGPAAQPAAALAPPRRAPGPGSD